jgi:hypothetical protein
MSLEQARAPHLAFLIPVAKGAMLHLPAIFPFPVEIPGELPVERARGCAERLVKVFVVHDRSPPLEALVSG